MIVSMVEHFEWEKSVEKDELQPYEIYRWQTNWYKYYHTLSDSNYKLERHLYRALIQA